MPRITFIEFNGTQHNVESEVGLSVMEAARNNDIPGIDADCGGVCACATCHVYVEDDWLATMGSADDDERELLEFTYDLRPQSRLSCQLVITEDMEGLIVKLPESQGY